MKFTNKIQPARKLILKNFLSPGDIVMLTAAVRDLHLCYPNQFSTDVRTPFPQLWENNPYITRYSEDEPGVEIIDCHYPLINRSNHAPYHVIHGFIEFLNQQLGVHASPASFKGDIHLSPEEKSWCSQIHELVGEDIPFWIIAAGGKHDVTIKWWDVRRFQEVVDYFKGKIQFVQVGASDHHHPPLKRVIDLRGKTDMRQLVRLVYHAQGVLCPVTLLMHLAAAVEVKDGMPKNRACVVVAGGREPMQWEAYPHHQFLHTNGALLCCDNGGCWKSRTVPLGDGDERDSPANLCVDVVGRLPRCMDMITSQDVVQRIELYFRGGALSYLTSKQALAARQAMRYGRSVQWEKRKLELFAFHQAAQRFIKTIPICPTHFRGRGIVICNVRNMDFPNAWVSINILRKSGCTLPVQLWNLRGKKLGKEMVAWLKDLNVECIEISSIRQERTPRGIGRYELKAYALLHSPFEEVLLLNADTIAIKNPEFLFKTQPYTRTGAIFWPRKSLSRLGSIWQLFETSVRPGPAFDTNQIVVHKSKCWRALSLCHWYSKYADFLNTQDQNEILRAAFVKTAKTYAMPKAACKTLGSAVCQHDFLGRQIFRHSDDAESNLSRGIQRIPRFLQMNDRLKFLKQLRRKMKK